MELVSIQLCQDAGQWKGRKREKQRFMGLREDIFLRWQSWERLGFEGGVECGVKWKMFSYVWLFESPWIVVQGILQANTGVGSLSLLQGIFPTQGSNPGLLHCGQILYQLSHKGSPRILEWVAHPFSSRSSQPRNQTGVSCIAGRFFTNWGIKEAQEIITHPTNLRINYCQYQHTSSATLN